MKFFLGILLLTTFSSIYADDVTDYIQVYAKTGNADYNLEQSIIKNNDLDKLINKLTPFYRDTLSNIRQKAYYLTYKKAVRSNNYRAETINILLNGCSDKDGSIVGQNLEYLKNFYLEDFDKKSIELINLKLTNHRVQHYKDVVLLAGFVGTGKDILYQKLLDQNVSGKIKWYVSLALARIGNPNQIEYCLNKVKAMPVNDNFIDYTVPDLIYTRQKPAIDLCIDILNKDEKLCHSLNPDNYESMVCGYRILEMLTPVIMNMPAFIDEQGNLSKTDYEKALNSVRLWFSNNKEYQIKKNTF